MASLSGSQADVRPSDEGSTQDPAAAAAPMPTPKIRHEWYQTDAHVVLSVLLKKAAQESVIVELTDTTCCVTSTLPGGAQYTLRLCLCHRIVAAESSHRVLSTKIEVKMLKRDAQRWASLEGAGETPSTTIFTADSSTLPAATTAAEAGTGAAAAAAAGGGGGGGSGGGGGGGGGVRARDWDALGRAIAEEERSEKLEGDAALNQLFQQIYADATEETRRAMNKSFVESGGTVLSTNWGEVGQKRVPIKPPDGMEWKDFEI